MIHCKECNKESEIMLSGQYTDVLVCGHTIIKSNNLIGRGANATEAESIKNQIDKPKELPKINGNELVQRALSGLSQQYEDFFNSENPIIEDIISEHGRDNAILIFTAIHSHLSKVLFCTNRFRNLYFIKIEQLRKEVEDKAVKELIANHDFNYENIAPKPKKLTKTPLSRTGTDIDKAKEGLSKLTGKDGKPIDVMNVMRNLMWKETKEKTEYKEGLDKIKEGIVNKEK